MEEKKNSLLIAMPALQESLFSHTVIFLVEHNSSGALGFIINSPTSTSVNEALSMMKIEHTQSLEYPILFGGPVQTDFFWVIHDSSYFCKSTMKIHQNFSLSSALDILPKIDSPDCPKIFHVGVGYSGWAPEQLEHEIEEGSWWLTDFNEEVVFQSNFDERWEKAIRSLGVDPDQLVDLTNPTHPSIN